MGVHGFIYFATMSYRIVFVLIFLLGGVFQSITVLMLIRGSDHYILKVFRRPLAIAFYLLFAVIMFALGIKLLLL